MRSLAARVILPLSAVTLFAGCGTLSNGRAWGEDATLFPSVDCIRRAALNAFTDSKVWAPAAGAAIFSIGNLDEEVSDWASDKTPVFGSQRAANKASDHLLAATKEGFWLTALAAPSGPEPDSWVISKLKGVGLEYGALKATGLGTTVLKKRTNLERPDGSDSGSFLRDIHQAPLRMPILASKMWILSSSLIIRRPPSARDSQRSPLGQHGRGSKRRSISPQTSLPEQPWEISLPDSCMTLFSD